MFTIHLSSSLFRRAGPESVRHKPGLQQRGEHLDVFHRGPLRVDLRRQRLGLRLQEHADANLVSIAAHRLQRASLQGVELRRRWQRLHGESSSQLDAVDLAAAEDDRVGVDAGLRYPGRGAARR